MSNQDYFMVVAICIFVVECYLIRIAYEYEEKIMLEMVFMICSIW